jgi:hypothetical protein
LFGVSWVCYRASQETFLPQLGDQCISRWPPFSFTNPQQGGAFMKSYAEGMSINHYTVPTAHGRWSPRPDVRDSVLLYLHKKVVDAYNDIPDKGSATKAILESRIPPTITLFDGWEMSYPVPLGTDGAWAYTIGRYDTALAMCWLLWNRTHADRYWQQIRTTSEAIGGMAAFTPPDVPCLAVVPNLNVLSQLPGVALRQIADMERCVAWLLIEAHLRKDELEPGDPECGAKEDLL